MLTAVVGVVRIAGMVPLGIVHVHIALVQTATGAGNVPRARIFPIATRILHITTTSLVHG